MRLNPTNSVHKSGSRSAPLTEALCVYLGMSESGRDRLRLTYFLIALFCSCSSLAQSYECPEKTLLNQILGIGDLYIGELHGTNEVPELFRCLIDEALIFTKEPIIVSIEMDECARDSNSPFWDDDSFFEDGRSSEAMYELIQYLVYLEEQELLDLHFQHGLGGTPIPSITGAKLKELSENAQVIALSGNIHSMQFLPEDFPTKIDTEGMFVGPNFSHITIGSALGGEAWVCMSKCGINSIGPSPNPDAVPGVLVNGKAVGHDYIYYLDIEGFTASRPMSNGQE